MDNRFELSRRDFLSLAGLTAGRLALNHKEAFRLIVNSETRLNPPIELHRQTHSLSCESASCAMAVKCRTVLVEPPSAMSSRIAFSNAGFVNIFRGVMSFRTALTAACPLMNASLRFFAEAERPVPHPGMLMPSASVRHAMVFAVYNP